MRRALVADIASDLGRCGQGTWWGDVVGGHADTGIESRRVKLNGHDGNHDHATPVGKTNVL